MGNPTTTSGPAPPDTAPATWPARMLPAALLIAIGSFLIHEIYSLDVWWQVTIGEDILTRKAIPTIDRFAQAGLGRPYHDSHWLFQIVLALAHRAAGMVGVESVMVLLWGITLFCCLRATRRWASPVLSYVLLFLVAMASIERFLPRPEIVTFCAIAAFALRLQRDTPPTLRDCVILGLLQVIWTNCHGIFVIGPFMVGCYWAAAGLGTLRGRTESGFRAYSGLLAVVLCATAISPHGPAGWTYAVLLLTEAGPNAPEALQSVGELSPTFGAAARSQPAFWFFATLLGGSLVSTIVGAATSRLSLPRLLIAVGLGAAAVTGRRNMPLFALVAAPLIAEHLRSVMPVKRRLEAMLAVPAALLMLGWSLFPLSGEYFLHADVPARTGLGVTPSFFPHGLPTFLDRIGFRGTAFNSNTVGGFYLYHGYPDRLPLTDGRWEVYEPNALQAIRLAATSADRWRGLVSQYDVDGALLQHASPEAATLLPILRADPRWKLVYYDYAASFWLTRDAPYDAPAIEPHTITQLPPAPGRMDDCLMLEPFLYGLNLTALRLANFERALSFNTRARRADIWGKVGALQAKLGRPEDAERTFRALLDAYPNDLGALNELAFYAYRRGDLEEALTLLDRALAVAPDHENTRANRRRVAAGLRGGQPERGRPAPRPSER